MSNTTEAGLDEAGFGRSTADTVLDGITKDDTHEDQHAEDRVADDLAHRMAALTVQAYSDRLGLSESECHDLLDMLDLPKDFTPPTEGEKELVARHLPKVIPMDTRSPDNHLTPERRGWRGSQVW